MPYIKRLHAVAGLRLYLNFFGMTLISSLEGIAVFLLVPMLSVIGALNMEVGSIPFISVVYRTIDKIPQSMQLPFMISAYVAIVICQAFLQRAQTINNSRIQQSFIRALRVETYQAILQAKWSLFLKKRRSDLNHMMTHELTYVTQGTISALKLGTSLVFTVIQIVFALWLSVKLTVFVLLSGLALALFARRFIRKAKKIGDKTNELSRSYMAGITDHFHGVKDIKSNMMEEQHLHWFQTLCRKMETNYLQFSKLQTASQLVYRIVSTLLIALFIWLSIQLFRAEPGQLMLVIIIFTRLWPRFTAVQSTWEQIVSTFPAFANMLNLLRECEAAKEFDLSGQARQQTKLRMVEGIQCRNLSFRYDPDLPEYALHDMMLTIPANGMTAVVGKSGAGKSTLIDLLIGLIEPESGEMRIDGRPLGKEQRAAIRSSVSYVSQDPFLFHTTIRENLTLAQPDATDEQLWEALRFSAADEFVNKLPQGLDTVIGDRGIRLSGGERQRLVLARAILRKPAILVLDEATSALDNENEIKIQNALDGLKGKLTVIVIAHRLSTIRNADQVIVMENGTIVQQGEYQQLSSETKGSFGKMLALG